LKNLRFQDKRAKDALPNLFSENQQEERRRRNESKVKDQNQEVKRMRLRAKQ